MKELIKYKVFRPLALLGFALVTSMALGQGGPPMITDDPGTPGNGKWEVNVAYITERTRHSTSSESPLFDINYGYGDRIQLKLEFPWLVTSGEGQRSRHGIGDSNVGVKWRFIDRGEGKLNVSVYPQFTFNTLRKSVKDGLVESNADLFLPFQFTQTFGELEVNAEVGYDVDRSGTHDFVYGICVGHEFPRGFELMAEFRSIVGLTPKTEERLGVVGFRQQVGAGKAIMASYGREIGHRHGDELPWFGYAGVQFNF